MKKKNASIRKYKKGRLSGYEAATGRAVKWFRARGSATKAKRKTTARRKSNCKRKRAANPKQLLFPTKAAATAYAKSHGIPKSRYSLKRIKKVR